MKVLILGAGAVGGYFGGRLVQAGADVTFLVRPQRAQKLAQTGLVIKSPLGDAQIPVRTVLQEAVRPDYDLVILSCKAYDLEASIAAIGGAMGPNTLILPLLNGMAQLPRLEQAFGSARVPGGTCYIASTLGADGSILHLGKFQGITCGPRAGNHAHTGALLQELAQAYARVTVECKVSADIEQDMWEKFVLLASLAAMTCLMRASVGEILAAADGDALMREMLSTCVAAAGCGRPRAARRIAAADRGHAVRARFGLHRIDAARHRSRRARRSRSHRRRHAAARARRRRRRAPARCGVLPPAGLRGAARPAERGGFPLNRGSHA